MSWLLPSQERCALVRLLFHGLLWSQVEPSQVEPSPWLLEWLELQMVLAGWCRPLAAPSLLLLCLVWQMVLPLSSGADWTLSWNPP
jgi:hypothetical protein